MGRKAQITLFIIVGLFLLVGGLFFMTLLDLGEEPIETQLSERFLLTDNVEPVKIYVEECLNQLSFEPINQIALLGGSLHPLNYRYYNGKKMQYFCTQMDNNGCVSSLINKQSMEKEIAYVIEERFGECANFNIFEMQGFRVERGELMVDVDIRENYVEVKADYPVVFIRNKTELTIDSFSSKVGRPLGKLYYLANTITNSENYDGYFDHVEYMTKIGVDVLIEKHRPYPDLVYSLEDEDMQFNFALQGKDTVSEVDMLSLETQESDNGCCYLTLDNSCYVNADRVMCEDLDGTYDSNPSCSCNSPRVFEQELCNGEECNPCESTYDYVTGEYNLVQKEHGESWCVYEGPVGKGQDYIGSRHYMHYCVDGVEYVEECRDYREEICVEEDMNGSSIATCRPNRWEDCYQCQSKACCENTNYRDCFWSPELENGQRCQPEVPPGFKFWEGNGNDVCNLASTEKLCDGFSCGSDWLTTVAKQCNLKGDCGVKRNIVDGITYDGLYYFDLQSRPNYNEIIPDEDKTLKGNDYFLDLPINTREQKSLLGNFAYESSDRFMKILVSVFSFIDQLSDMDVFDFASNKNSVDFMAVSICGNWKAFDGGEACSHCTSGLHPCTEYRCMSLGQQCIYEEKEGIGICHKMQDLDDMPPKIEINEDSLSEGYSLSPSTFNIAGNDYRGYKINENVSPYRVFSMNLSTKKETICEMALFPDGFIDAYYVGNEGFSENHEVVFRIPSQPSFPKKMLDLFNASSPDSFSNIFKTSIMKLDSQKKQNDLLHNIYLNLLGVDVIDSNSLERLSDFMKLMFTDVDEKQQVLDKVFTKIDSGGYYLFFTCKDRAGNKNDDNFFIEVDIDDVSNDDSPPKLLGSDPTNNSLFGYDEEKIPIRFYMNEPAECRYDFYDMNYSNMSNELTCTRSFYQLSPEFRGSYLCFGLVPVVEDTLGIYIRCLDNPQTYSEKIIDVIEKGRKKEYGNIMLTDNVIDEEIIEFNAKNITIDYHMSDNLNCSLSYDGVETKGNCTKSPSFAHNLYECSFNLYINDSFEENMRNISDTSDNDSSLSFFEDRQMIASILCQEKDTTIRNVNDKSIFFTMNKSMVFEAIDFGPIGTVESKQPLLYVETSNSSGIRCGYFKEYVLGTMKMENIEGNRFGVLLDSVDLGTNIFYVYCSDEYGNEFREEVNFYVK